MAKDRAIELGLKAYRSEGEARWMYGDALIEYGWKPADHGKTNTGGMELIEAFRQELVAAEGAEHLELQMLPDAITLSQYATASFYLPEESRRNLSIWVAYKAASIFKNDTSQKLQVIERKHGKINADFIDLEAGRSPSGHTSVKRIAEDPDAAARVLSQMQPQDRVQVVREAFKDEAFIEELRHDPAALSDIDTGTLKAYPEPVRRAAETRIPKDFHWTPEGKLLEAFAYIYWAYSKIKDMSLDDQRRADLLRQAEHIEDWSHALAQLLRGETSARELFEDIDALLAEARSQ